MQTIKLISSAVASFAFVALILPFYINFLKKIKLSQNIRSEGPKDHLSKSSTPTMGGVILVLGIIISVFWSLSDSQNLALSALLLLTALIGFADDFICFIKHRSLGLRARDKIIMQLIVGALFAFYLMYFKNSTGSAWGFQNEPSVFYFIWVILVYIASSNAVNLTDGLDGLAGSLSAVVFLTFAVIFYLTSNNDLALFCLSGFGACAGFLIYNINPAKIFMGDTGSLALGGVFAGIALMSQTEFLYVIIGGVFVTETLSVMLQVIYFKLTKGKRIFKMSPLHHHFELSGWHETLVTKRFVICGIMLAIISMFLYMKI